MASQMSSLGRTVIFISVVLFMLTFFSLLNVQVSRGRDDQTSVPQASQQYEKADHPISRHYTIASLNDELHLFIQGEGLGACSQDLIGQRAETLNESSEFVLTTHLSQHQPQFSTLCLATHGHHHSVTFNLRVHDASKTCRLYLSTQHLSPDSVHWDWRADSASDSRLVVFTFADEFKRSIARGLFLGIHGDADRCDLSVKIDKYDNFQLLSRAGLRGGQILLPRDVKDIMRADILLPQ